MIKIAGLQGSVKAVRLIANGIRAHGDVFEYAVTGDEFCKNADAYVQTNLLKPKYATDDRSGPYEYILESKKPFLVKESPSFRKYIDSGWVRLGWNSYKWTEGVFGNENSPPDRWNKFVKDTGIALKDWKSPGDKILLMGQKEGDSSLVDLYNKGYKSFYNWVFETVQEIRKHSDREIIIRPHPRNFKAGLKGSHWVANQFNNVSVSENFTHGGNQGGEGLDTDLQNAHCVVTYNSLSSVEAACDGIPVFALNDGSMAWPVAHKDLSKIENLDLNIDRTQWCNDIAYTQWNWEEQDSGEFWAHLKPLMFKDN